MMKLGSFLAMSHAIKMFSDDDEDIQPIVIDLGSSMIKAGWAGDDAPRAVFPAVVGRPKYPAIMVGMDQKVAYVGDEAISKRVHVNFSLLFKLEGVLKLSWPIERGIVQDWDDVETLLHHTFYNELRVDPAEHPIVLTESVLNPRANRERLAQIMFETFDVPALYFGLKPVLSLTQTGDCFGVVLDVGDTVTEVVPVYQGMVIEHAVMRVDLGGRDITEYFTKMMTERGHYWTTTSEKDEVRRIKETLGYVAQDFDAEMLSSSELEQTYELPDGPVIRIGQERFRAAEVLFQPHLIGKEAMGIHELVLECINKCAIDIRKNMSQGIVLTGGSASLPGLKDRLQKELIPGLKTRVRVNCSDHPKYDSWIGGSIVGSLSAIDSEWMSRPEYDDSGPSLVHTKWAH